MNPATSPIELLITSQNSSGARRYMSKRQSACDACRIRKSACQVENKPPCRLCHALSKPCTFTGHKIKRTSCRNKVQEQSSGDHQNAATPTTRSTPPFTENASLQEDPMDLTPPEDAGIQSVLWTDSLYAENLAIPGSDHNWLESPISPNFSTLSDSAVFPAALPADPFDIDLFIEMFNTSPLPQTRERSLDDLGDMTAQFCGSTGDMDPFVLRRYRYNENGEFNFSKLSVRNIQDEDLPVQFLLSPRELSLETRNETELVNDHISTSDEPRIQLNALIQIETGSRLIKLFFDFIQPQIPLLSVNNTPSPHHAPVELLAAIYCISQQFATYDDRLCIDFAYKLPSAQKLFNIAWRGLNRSLVSPTIATVQTMLILLLKSPTNDLVLDSAFKWSLVGTVVSTAQNIGLHLDSKEWNLPKHEALLRRRLSWAVFAFDKWFATSLGRPSHINSNDWLVDRLEISDLQLKTTLNIEVETSWCLQLSQLTVILDEVLADLFSLKAIATLSKSYTATMARAKDLTQRLRECSHVIGLHSHQVTPGHILAEPDPRALIQLCYHAINLLIFRALLRPFYHAKATIPEDAQERTEWCSARLNVRRGAKLSAEAALKTVSSLKACHYQAFWPPWCKTHFAIIMNMLCFLTITSSAEESTEALSLLNQARQIYRVQSRSFAVIKFALLRTDALFWIGLDELINKQADLSNNEETNSGA